MSSGAKFYRQFILEASRSQKHHGEISEDDLKAGEEVIRLEGENPSCGDRLTLYLKIKTMAKPSSNFSHGKILDAKFEGSGCAVSLASAHFLCEKIIGKTVDAAQKYIEAYLSSLDSGVSNPDYAPFDNFALMPGRVKCARLGWGTVNASFNNTQKLAIAQSTSLS